MRRTSLNPQNKSFPPARDDGTLLLGDLAFFLSQDPRPHFRLTTATALQRIEAGITLKRGWQGLRLARFYIKQDRWVHHGQVIHERWLASEAIVFQLPPDEAAELCRAPFASLLAIWLRDTSKTKYQKRMSYAAHDDVDVDEVRWQ
jgi:hypothetical protein